MDDILNFEELAEEAMNGAAIQNEVLMRHMNGGVPVEAATQQEDICLAQAA